MASTPRTLTIDIGGQRWRATDEAYDLSIPLRFDSEQPSFFAAPQATSQPYRIGEFSGSVNTGASCNCSTQTLTPHCNGTHTECVGHITGDKLSIRDFAPTQLQLALLMTVTPRHAKHTRDTLGPVARVDDLVIDEELIVRTVEALNSKFAKHATALIIRTLPNHPSKQLQNYDSICPPYFTAQATKYIASRGIEHLLVDLPSIDRAHDQGLLSAHREFWGMPAGSHDAQQASRRSATITELCFIDDSVMDGIYLLNLQVAPFDTDAAPSRPIIYPLLLQTS